MNTQALIADNQHRWGLMCVHAWQATTFEHIAANLVRPFAKARYENVSEETGVPWYVIAVIHERESSQSWLDNLAQGDPWNRPSHHDPHTPAFASWEDSAVYALKDCAPHLAAWKDWTSGGTLTALETYNGLGYAERNKPSPYVWAGSNQYISGKYISDHRYDPNAVDHQLGCAPLLAYMMKLDNSVNLP